MKTLKKVTDTYLKKTCVFLLLLMAFTLSGCGNHSTIEIVTEKKTYPEPDEVCGSLADAGYEVEKFESFEELGYDVTRIKAEKDGQYFDMCYNVPSSDELDTIIEYYMGNYKQYNLVSDSDIVYCYSDESVIADIGLAE